MKTKTPGRNAATNTREIFFGLALAALLPILETRAAHAAVPLGSAGTFGVLGGSTVVNVGFTIVYGDLGLSPSAALVGFPPGQVNGTIHVADAIAALAHSDLAMAYSNAVGRTQDVILVAGDLGGLVLTQGLYRSISALAVATGNLTLDAQGDTNAVWIFQMGSTLNTAASTQIILINGARSANVIWQVGSSATLGASSIFRGTILADQSITLGAGVLFDGRALAVNAAVTLDSDIFLVETSVVLVSAPAVAGPYTDAPILNMDLQTRTITTPALDRLRFYALRSSTPLTFTNISIRTNAVLELIYTYPAAP